MADMADRQTLIGVAQRETSVEMSEVTEGKQESVQMLHYSLSMQCKGKAQVNYARPKRATDWKHGDDSVDAAIGVTMATKRVCCNSSRTSRAAPK